MTSSFLNAKTGTWLLTNGNYISREMAFLSSSKVWLPAALFLSSFTPSRICQHRKRPKSGFKYLRPGLPQGTIRADSCQEQLPATLPATTASLLSVCRWIGWSLETKKALLHATWKPQKNAFPTEPPSCSPLQALPRAPLWHKVLPSHSEFAAAQEMQGSEGRWTAAQGGYSFCQGSDQARKFARREKEMKGQLPPTSTPSRSILFSGSSQNHPKFSLLPHSHHTPLCHFRMGFATWLRACGCARLSAQLPQQSTRAPSSSSIPPAWDCLAEAPPCGRLFVTPLGSVVSNCSLSCFFLQLGRIYFNIFSIPADAEASSFYFSPPKVIPLSQSSQSPTRPCSFWRPAENCHTSFLIWHAPPLCYILGWKWFMISSAHEKISSLFPKWFS